mgnify:FL=1
MAESECYSSVPLQEIDYRYQQNDGYELQQQREGSHSKTEGCSISGVVCVDGKQQREQNKAVEAQAVWVDGRLFLHHHHKGSSPLGTPDNLSRLLALI